MGFRGQVAVKGAAVVMCEVHIQLTIEVQSLIALALSAAGAWWQYAMISCFLCLRNSLQSEQGSSGHQFYVCFVALPLVTCMYKKGLCS
jgi:hypothetical protein